MSRTVLIKNAFANVCRGGAAALVMLLTPIFLTRILSKDTYGTWLLILQIATYVSFLDFGIQNAVGRFIAHYSELGDFKKRDSVVSTSLAILSFSGVLAMLGVATLAWNLPGLFRDMPVNLYQEAKITLLLVGGSLSVTLPFNVFGAICIGLQRYDIPAWIIGASRLVGGAIVVLVANSSHSIVMMGLVMGLSNLSGGVWQYFACKRVFGNIKVFLNGVSRESALEVFTYCYGLLIWNIGTILVSGLDTAIVGYFDYKSVIYYSLAASITNFVTGIQGSLFATLLPNAAAVGARGDGERLGQLLVSSTRYATITLILTSLPLVMLGRWMLNLWVGESYASHTFVLLQLLVIANFIRLIGTPYAVITMAVGEQKLIMLSPLIEGVINFFVSVLLTSKIGVMGVAVGTIIGSIISIFSHFLYNLPRSKAIILRNNYSLLQAVARPSYALGPLLLYFLVFYSLNGDEKGIAYLFSCCITLLLTTFAMYFYAVTSEEKQLFSSFAVRKVKSFLL
jgi:O-antigen/teichoic acid export membrane protein